MTTTTTNGAATGHARHSNGHATPATPMGHPPRPSYVPPAPVVANDPVTGETVVDLAPEHYRECRVDVGCAVDFTDATPVVFREVDPGTGRPTGRWFVRERGADGWATQAEATIPERAAV